MLAGNKGERLDQLTVQLLTAVFGFAATLGGVLITQHANRRGEAARRRYEAQSRWHEENYRVCAAIVTKATAVERKLHSAVSMLDDEEREPRMLGTKSILLSPEGGIEGCFDATTREILVGAIEDGFKVLDEIEDLAGELAIVGTPDQALASRRLGDQILDAVGAMEAFARSSDTYDEVRAIGHAREEFAKAARSSLVAVPK